MGVVEERYVICGGALPFGLFRQGLVHHLSLLKIGRVDVGLYHNSVLVHRRLQCYMGIYTWESLSSHVQIPGTIRNCIFSSSNFNGPLFRKVVDRKTNWTFRSFSNTPFTARLRYLLAGKRNDLNFYLFNTSASVMALVQTGLGVAPIRLRGVASARANRADR